MSAERDAHIQQLEAEIHLQVGEKAKLLAALTKIDAIRNSIIGCQKVNWSEHIYPLVAALGEAGFDGQEYETARANVGTLIEQVKAAEARVAEAYRDGFLNGISRQPWDDMHDWLALTAAKYAAPAGDRS